MHIHSLEFSDLDQDKYSLIGIHTTLEDYKLAYHLNNNIRTNFSKASYNLELTKENNTLTYTLFDYTNHKYDFDWFLISNSCNQKNRSSNNQFLFNSEIKNYLIPEKKNVDYFIKIIGESDTFFLKKTISNINRIPNVITSYLVDYNKLKSKDFLIF